MEFTTDQIKALAQMERDMDAGEQPYVICGGRWAFSAEILDRFGIVSGQTVSITIRLELQKATIENLKAKIEAEKNLH